MKTIGLLGGMSWESSQEYYRIINEEARLRLGGLHSAQSLMFSFDFAEIETLQANGEWDEATRRMVRAARDLERGGADVVLICTNTMHIMANQVQEAIAIPLLHIVDPTAEALAEQDVSRVGLLGTAYTMEQDFYKGRLRDRFGVEVLVPNAEERQLVHHIIYDELCVGVISDSSRKRYIDIIQTLGERGAQAVILGCTEIGLLLRQEDTTLPVFDTTHLHARAAVRWALQ